MAMADSTSATALKAFLAGVVATGASLALVRAILQRQASLRLLNGSQIYESEKAVREYLLMHFGKADEICQWSFGPKVRCYWVLTRTDRSQRSCLHPQEALEFPARCAKECIAVAKSVPKSRALDVGCAVGRSSFELVRPPTQPTFTMRACSFHDGTTERRLSGRLCT